MITPCAVFKNLVVAAGGCSGTASYVAGASSAGVDMTFTNASNLYRKYCFIIKAADFSADAGDKRTIDSITLRYNTSDSYPVFVTYFQVYIRNTTNTSVGSGGNSTSDLNNKKIYDAGSSGITSGNETTYSGGTNLIWDGTSNILVTIFTKGTSSVNLSAGFYRTATTTGYSWGMYQDATEATARGNITGFVLTGAQEVFVKLNFSC